MLQKLESLEARFEEITALFSAPDVVNDLKRLRDLGRERQRLEGMVTVYRQLRDVTRSLTENRTLVEEGGDPDLIELAREELPGLIEQEHTLTERLKVLLLPPDPNDGKNIILEIRSGTGGDEAALFVGDLFRMYNYIAQVRGWKVDALSLSPGTQGGFKEVIVSIEGSDVYSWLKYESGVHRVQRVPETETQGRIHTSVVTVAVLPEAEEIEIDIADKDLRIDVYRSSGPGGQSVNTTDSAVRVTHIPTGLVVACQDEKSQHKNKAKALKILRARLFDRLQAEQAAKMALERKSMVKSGDRSDKIRTYNFPQDRLTDHRIGFTKHNLENIMQGDLEDVITALRTHYQAEALKIGVSSI